MILYRLAKTQYAKDLSGKGAELVGGRWNSKGHAMVYTCESRALCTAEIAVHTPLGIIPNDFSLITIHVPGGLPLEEVKIADLPESWRIFPYGSYTQALGDVFIKNKKSLLLRVPSAVVQGDFNILINPDHKEFGKVRIEKTESFLFDERLFKR